MSFDDTVVSVRGLSKVYRVFGHPGDRLKQAMTFGLRRFHREFQALKDINFVIRQGESVGIVGGNGSGKSTLLQLICGILRPTAGSIETTGRVSALLELGAGFNPEFTGRENVYFQGTLMGLSRSDMDARFDEISAFADIGDFIDQPVRTYSSGMFVRLAFAVGVSVDPDILVIDEALAVGDVVFQAKGARKMREFREAGKTLILVSHDMTAVKSLCDRVLFLDHGVLRDDGPSGRVCDEYVAECLLGQAGRGPTAPHGESRRPEGAGRAKVSRVSVDPAVASACVYGHDLLLRIEIDIVADVEKLVASFYIKDAQQLEVIGTSTAYEGVELGPLAAGESRTVVFRFRNPLRAGLYSVTVVLSDDARNTRHYYDWVDHACSFESHDVQGEKRWAMTGPRMDVQVLGGRPDVGELERPRETG